MKKDSEHLESLMLWWNFQCWYLQRRDI